MLRAVRWLRDPDLEELPSICRRRIMEALEELEGLPSDALSRRLFASRAGELFIRPPGLRSGLYVRVSDGRQMGAGDLLDLIAPPDTQMRGARNLVRPDTMLLIVPGKLSGQPHVAGTRLDTETLYELHRDGYSAPQIARLYELDDSVAVDQAVRLEEWLEVPALAA